MSRRRASSVEMREEQDTPLHADDNGGENELPFTANGSVYSKLFAKATRSQVAVASEEQVEARENGQNHGDSMSVEGENDSEGNGNGFADGVDVEEDEDDEDDDEYDPNDASDAEYSEESDDSSSDLDDEETSMRSLLLPMATYAKQLLFLSDEEDNGEFDEQDAELWASEQEKRAWAARYDAANRTFEEKYGCRIDSPAIPEVKRKLRRERKRESKYSIVLVVLAVAYLIRLMVGGPTSTVTVTPTLTKVESESAIVTETPTTTHAQVKDASHPLWWTENLVVRVVTWPSQLFKSKTDSIAVKQSTKSQEEIKTETPVRSTTPKASTVTPPAENKPVADVVVRDDKEHEHETVEREETTRTIVIDVAVSEEVERAGTVDVVVETEVDELDVAVVKVSTADETTVAPAVPEQNREIEATNTALPAEKEEPVVDTDVVMHGPEVEEAKPQSATADLLIQCTDLFYKVIKTKNDADLKNAAIAACDAAVQSSSAADKPAERIQARVVRGDLKSLLYNFDEARVDYEMAIAHAQTSDLPPDARATMELKLAANRWIELYQTKRFKELRSECERVTDADFSGETASEAHGQMQGVASEWLRVFKRETKLMDALVKTRAWTISPLKLQ